MINKVTITLNNSKQVNIVITDLQVYGLLMNQMDRMSEGTKSKQMIKQFIEDNFDSDLKVK